MALGDGRFPTEGWHDVYVHGLAYDGEAGRFFLDLDYILEWVHPVESTDRHYSFWMSPATMVFEDVSELHVDLQPLAAFEIESLKRTDQQVEEGPGGRAGSERWRWTMAFFNGEISLRSSGYRLHRSPRPPSPRRSTSRLMSAVASRSWKLRGTVHERPAGPPTRESGLRARVHLAVSRCSERSAAGLDAHAGARRRPAF